MMVKSIKGIPINEYKRKYYKKNKRKIYLKSLEYKRKHKDKVSIWNRRHYLKIKNLWDSLTQEEQFNLMWKFAKKILR